MPSDRDDTAAIDPADTSGPAGLAGLAGPADTSDLIDALTRVSALVEHALDRAAAEYGSSPAQARMLRALGRDAPTINELAARLALDKSSTSGLVDRAEQRGLVRRLRSQLDRRSVRVRLTGEGRDRAGEISVLLDVELTAMLEPLAPGERLALTALIARLLA